MTPDRAAIDELRAAYAHCFGCGLGNPAGLQLDGFEIENSGVTAPFHPTSTFAGFEGVLHGGIVATALDEISAWSAMLTEGVLVFTAKLDIRYRKQAGADTAFVLSGSVRERRGKRLTIDARMTDEGVTVAESQGLFVAARNIDDLA